MIKKFITFLLLIVMTFSLTGCTNNYKIYDYKNNVLQSAFNGWVTEFNNKLNNVDYEVIFNGEIHEKIENTFDGKEMYVSQYDNISKEVAKFDLENTTAITTVDSSSFNKTVDRYGKEEEKSKVDSDYNYQMIDNVLYKLDNNKKKKQICGLRYDLLVKNYLKNYELEEILEECNKFYVDKNVYTATYEEKDKKIVCQIVVSDNQITIVSEINVISTKDLTNGMKEKCTSNVKKSYIYNIKDINITAKNAENYNK